MTDKQKETLYQTILSMANTYLAVLPDDGTETNFITDFKSIQANAQSKLKDLWSAS